MVHLQYSFGGGNGGPSALYSFGGGNGGPSAVQFWW